MPTAQLTLGEIAYHALHPRDAYIFTGRLCAFPPPSYAKLAQPCPFPQGETGPQKSDINLFLDAAQKIQAYIHEYINPHYKLPRAVWKACRYESAIQSGTMHLLKYTVTIHPSKRFSFKASPTVIYHAVDSLPWKKFIHCNPLYLPIQSRTRNALRKAGITSMQGVWRRGETGLLDVHRFGKTCLQDLKTALGKYGNQLPTGRKPSQNKKWKKHQAA